MKHIVKIDGKEITPTYLSLEVDIVFKLSQHALETLIESMLQKTAAPVQITLQDGSKRNMGMCKIKAIIYKKAPDWYKISIHPITNERNNVIDIMESTGQATIWWR